MKYMAKARNVNVSICQRKRLICCMVYASMHGVWFNVHVNELKVKGSFNVRFFGKAEFKHGKFVFVRVCRRLFSRNDECEMF